MLNIFQKNIWLFVRKPKWIKQYFSKNPCAIIIILISWKYCFLYRKVERPSEDSLGWLLQVFIMLSITFSKGQWELTYFAKNSYLWHLTTLAFCTLYRILRLWGGGPGSNGGGTVSLEKSKISRFFKVPNFQQMLKINENFIIYWKF